MLGRFGGIVLLGLRAYDSKEVSLALGVDTGGESLVQQQFTDEVNINTIVRRFGLTREMPSGRAGGVYGDFSGITDYESAVAAVERAQDGFMSLDPDVRQQFGNDPGRYLEYVESLSDEEIEAQSRPAPEPVPAPVPQPRNADGTFAAPVVPAVPA